MSLGEIIQVIKLWNWAAVSWKCVLLAAILTPLRFVQHVNAIKFTSPANNNKMERINGEIRDREKTMRGLKKKDTTILQGMQVFHNFIRSHEGLDGKTPAKACGIEIRVENYTDTEREREGEEDEI